MPVQNPQQDMAFPALNDEADFLPHGETGALLPSPLTSHRGCRPSSLHDEADIPPHGGKYTLLPFPSEITSGTRRPSHRCKRHNWTWPATRGAPTCGTWPPCWLPATATPPPTPSGAPPAGRWPPRRRWCRSTAPPRCCRCHYWRTATACSSSVSPLPASWLGMGTTSGG